MWVFPTQNSRNNSQGSPTYLRQQQGADDGQGGLEVVLEPESHGVDAAPDVDGAEQLQALGERREDPKFPLDSQEPWLSRQFCQEKPWIGDFFGPRGEVFVLTLPKEISELRFKCCQD